MTNENVEKAKADVKKGVADARRRPMSRIRRHTQRPILRSPMLKIEDRKNDALN